MRCTDISTWPCSWKMAVRWLLLWYVTKLHFRGESRFVDVIVWFINRTKIFYNRNFKNCFRLFFGFVSNPDGTNTNINWSDLNIYQFGENGRVTEELCFLIKIGKSYLNNNMFLWLRIKIHYMFFVFICTR